MTKMKSITKNAERGIALFFSLFALLLLMAIAGSLTFMASIETSVNSNYRQEQLAYFAAKAGIEEARARMMQSDPNTINAAGTALPITAPTTTNASVIYIVNPAGASDTVQPWSSSNKYADDEFCHDGYSGAASPPSLFTTAQVVAPGVRCTSNGTATGTPVLPSGTAWFTSYTSQLPNKNTVNALPYKWVRISPKLNASVSYLDVTGSTPTITNYKVNSKSTYNAGTMICWDGTEEVPLNTADTNCSQMLNTAGAPMTSVYELAALGVSPTGARKMVQAETALTPTPPFIYGMYSTSTACPAITFTGNNPSTNSYTTAGGKTYSQTAVNTGGDVGAAGGINVGNGNIGGIVGVLAYSAGPPQVGCPTPVSMSSNGTMDGTVSCPSGNNSNPPTSCYLQAPYSFSVPIIPSSPPNTATTPSTCGKGKSAYDCLVPNVYGNISITQPLTLAPGTYYINSLSMTGNAQIIVSPPGAVVLNVRGYGQTTAVAIAGNGITDDTIPNDFIINYGGTDAISIAGNGNVTAILNAPNAPLSQQGNGNWYGSILAGQMTIGGNAFFHYDRNAALAPINNGYYTMISYREVSY